MRLPKEGSQSKNSCGSSGPISGVVQSHLDYYGVINLLYEWPSDVTRW